MEQTSLDLGDSIKGAISRIRFAPSSNNLLISSWDSILRLYDVDGSVLRSELRTECALLDCCFEREDVALAACMDGFVRRFDLSTGIEDVVGSSEDSVTSTEYSSETGIAISCSLDKKMNFWDLRRRNVDSLCTVTVESDVKSLSLCGTTVLAAIGTSVICYDLRYLSKAVPVDSKHSPMEYSVRCVSSFSNLQGFVMGSVDGCVALKYFDHTEKTEENCIFWCHPKSEEGRGYLVSVNEIACHPCCDIFVTGDNEGYALVWNAKSRKRIFEFPRHPNSIASMSWNKDGGYLAIASSYTYQRAIKSEERSQIYVHSMEKFAQLCYSRTPKNNRV